MPNAKLAPPKLETVEAKTYVNWELKITPGVRIIHMDGYGNVRFHIETGKGNEQKLLVALQEFILDHSAQLSEDRTQQHVEVHEGHLLPKETA